MSYKIYLFDALSPIEWSQAGWKVEGDRVNLEDCDIEFIRDVLLRALPHDGLIVDAGCGTARWPIYLRKRGYRVVGVEWSQQACAIARTNDAGLEVVRGDVRLTPLKDASVDAVLSLGVVEHDEVGPHAALREARRILKPGGVIVLAVPFNNPARRLLVNHLQTYVTAKRRRANWKLGFAEYRFSTSEVKALLAECGFEPVSAHPNDLLPPKNVGLWVDYNNLTINPFKPLPREELFVLPGLFGRVAAWLANRTPWLVCGEVVVVARAV